MQRIRRAVKAATLAAVLGLTAFVVPPSAVQSTEVSLVKVRHAAGVAVGGEDVVWILAVGSDARPGEVMTRSRGDALQLVGINTRTGSATAIGVPRDSWVSIPGHGREKINSALYFAGPQGMAGAMRNLVGIEPDYVMVTRFPFFEDMVDDIGGITVANPRRITTCVVRGRVGFVGAASVVFPDVAQARRLGREARADAALRGC